MKKNVMWFSEISKEDVPLVGGKGANLGELFGLGLPVPGGFCITAGAYREFISPIQGHILKMVTLMDTEDHDDVRKNAALISELVLGNKIPGHLEREIIQAYKTLVKEEKWAVAVRSSATAEDLPKSSFAGQHETFLNVTGEKGLLDAVQKCWASLWTPRAIMYREKRGFDHARVGMCVVVQAMIFPYASGVLFTYNSLKGSGDEMVIESTFGLGEALVS